MSLFVLTGLLSLGVVPVAFATEVDAPAVVDAELTLDAPGVEERTGPLEAPIAFTSMWAELPDGLDAVRVRTSPDGHDWSAWTELAEADDLDAPDPGTPEAVAAAARPRVTELLQSDEARYVQVEAVGDGVADVVLQLVDTDGLNESMTARLVRHLTPRPVPAEAATVPSWIKPRSAWGATPYKGSPSIARDGVKQVVIHHTAGPNTLRVNGSCDEAKVAARIRADQHFHQNGRGWSDLGYNVVIDPCGGVWEGREGGLDRAVVGAHAAGNNTGSTGISVLGNYEQLTPNPQILAALDRVVGWKAGIHGIDTQGTVSRTIKLGNTTTTKTYSTVVGHRDVGNTACPGLIMNSLPRIRSNAKAQASGWTRVPDGTGAVGAAAPPRFSDTTGNAHAAAIEQLVERGIAGGYDDGTYRPQLPVTRAQVATFLTKALGLQPIPGGRFADVPAGYVHAGAINALVAEGILGGYPDDTFRPGEPLRREHMAAVITRALELDLRPDAASVFSDVTAYVGEIGAIADAGIAAGRGDGTFQPKASVTRGQMATFLVNAVRLLDEHAGA